MSKDSNVIDLNKVVLVDEAALSSLITKAAGQLNAQVTNQNAGATSSIMETMAKMVTQGRSDEDVNGVELVRSMMPAWLFNMKLATGVELGKYIDSQLQSTIAGYDALTQARLSNLGAINHAAQLNQSNASSYDRNKVLAEKTVAGVVTEPNYFNENAPAAQDTPGEGQDYVPAIVDLSPFRLGADEETE